MLKTISPLAALLVLVCFACDDDNDIYTSPVRQIEFELVVLDEMDRELDAFPPATDIRIILKMINNTEQNFDWKEGFTCQVLNSDGFMDVFKKNETGISPPISFIGTPYQRPIDCDGVYIPPMIYPPGETVVLAIPWSLNANNEPLTDGEYFVTATLELDVDDEHEHWQISTPFVIK